MARINTTELVQAGTSLSQRAYQVQKDPAVQKAWNDAGSDLTRAVTSVVTAVNETRAAWRRTGAGAEVSQLAA